MNRLKSQKPTELSGRSVGASVRLKTSTEGSVGASVRLISATEDSVEASVEAQSETEDLSRSISPTE